MGFLNAKPSRCRSAFFQMVVFVLLLLSSHGAKAAWCSGGGGQVMPVSMPASVAVPRDTPIGTALTGWISSPTSTNWYTNCQTGPASAVSNSPKGLAYQAVGLSGSGKTYTNSGVIYSLWETGVPGVGMAVSYEVYSNAYCGGTGWQSWGDLKPGGGNSFGGGVQQAISGWSTYAPCGWANTEASPMNMGGGIRAMLVTTGPVSPGVTNAGTLVQAAGFNNYAINTDWPFVTFAFTSTQITVLACTTPDVTVPLGAHSRTELTGLNTFTAATSFNVSLNSCPASMNTIQYRIDPVTTVLNSAQSVVALDGSSSATGVGVQLLDGNGAVMPLATYKTFSGYSKTTGGSYTIPFKARYYQTAATVGPGTANSAMTFTMLYQ
ncbi:fimbrial protein [Dyella japonica]|uniref:fimbrial protein n=1 Tax=Dyella japonica TaxID=231455 RepID=UPI000B316444|nr:fimbrial protein [Dyella japonica]